ncbi:MAG TPA: transporter substrate-binding domain-containing protein [Thermotogota bacterium]|nr:transporter substrate-binding domain-containing protein [Thermotogota bacterium]HPJ88594.1 transporter substrate-binding domain-containing protein [Thermotogota bacterium]HPR96666.1 transporter substrate-binding domain-containing protein [Thermotogota bacterium]
MKKIVLFSAILSLLVTSVLASALNFITNPYPPFSFEKDGKLDGFAVEIAKAVADELGEDITFTHMEWTDAYNTLKTETNCVIPSLVMNSERKEQFNWVGPVGILRTGFYKKASNAMVINHIEEAKVAKKICLFKDEYSGEVFKALGFENILLFDTQKEAFDTFMSHEDYLFICNNFGIVSLLQEKNMTIDELTDAFTFSADFMYIAFSKDVDASVVAKWQNGLDTLKDNGSFEKIYKKWLPWGFVPGKQVFLTEEYPPLTYTDAQGTPTGFVTDLVKVINEKMNGEEAILVLDWSVAYNAAVLNPNVVLFSIAQTENRKPLFNWVGPVVKNSAYFYRNAASDLVLPSADYAKKVGKIATTASWWTEQKLKEDGFTNLVSYTKAEDCVKALVKGEVDLSVFTNLTVTDIVKDAGYTMSDMENILLLDSIDVFIAISKGTPEAFIKDFQKTYDSIVMDGTYAKLYNGYFEK